ncbi:HlyD family efflux transporter periplasmic adaptor subunit [Stieleria sp. TO1_6]|uniref:efflux RND transporter periplasmic adaptor subunit n=1 Tax=Stieleria tagensis TaxID=2956795 RepID=UPI00209B87A4|nr:HlyD family efflux transporter periplasmic adaptor subunit [Stieleria tagensis]MCO8121602.1 HlyD family efflux transporter periplasmic adaptor subunit [Stieleria tagensis]
MKQLSCLLMALAMIGCGNRDPVYPPKPPRAVTTMTLQQSEPDSSYLVSGSVKSWKTEAIGFEIPGRIQWVLEPGENVFGRVEDAEGRLISQGTPLAKIDPERYEVAVESAKAALDVATLEVEVASIRMTESIPADLESAKSDLELAKIDFERAEKLKLKNAISASQYDAAANRMTTRSARISSLESTLKQSAAELKSAQARVESARQTLRDAQRDLANTTLYAAYRGQISSVDVVPGSVVTAGAPVLTLQMMDPIKVQIEVSAEQSRRLQRRQQVPVTFVGHNQQPVNDSALVYVVDPSADPATRTFSVTLLILNQQARPPLPDDLAGCHVARTQDVWPLQINSIIGVADDTQLVEEDAIETTTDGSYVWLMSNASKGEPIPDLVKLEKRKVELLDLRIPYLGNWVFRQVKFVGDAPSPRCLLAGQLEFPDDDRQLWDQTSLVFDSGPQWMLRPGDLVQVNLSSQSLDQGYFVPVDAVYQDAGSAFVFVVDAQGDQTIASKTPVRVVIGDDLDTGSVIQILPMDSEQFSSDTQIVVEGVHFLDDGEPISIQRGDRS